MKLRDIRRKLYMRRNGVTVIPLRIEGETLAYFEQFHPRDRENAVNRVILAYLKRIVHDKP
jgi:hypothetical protein